MLGARGKIDPLVPAKSLSPPPAVKPRVRKWWPIFCRYCCRYHKKKSYKNTAVQNMIKVVVWLCVHSLTNGRRTKGTCATPLPTWRQTV